VFKQRIMQDWDSPFPFAGREWGLRDANLFISNTAVTLYTSLGQSVNAPHESTPLDSPIRNAYTDMHNIYQLDNNIYVHKPSELRNVSTQDIRTISKQLYGLAGEQDWEGLDLQQTALVSEKTEEKAIHLVAQKMPSSFPGVRSCIQLLAIITDVFVSRLPKSSR
jgi:hypothetical protein